MEGICGKVDKDGICKIDGRECGGALCPYLDEKNIHREKGKKA